MAVNRQIFNKLIKQLALNKILILKVKVTPHSGQLGLVRVMTDETLKIALKNTSREGKANQELTSWLAKSLSVDRDQITIISGLTNCRKLVKITA